MSDRNPSPYDAPELYDLLFDSLDFDIPYWLDVARAAKGPLLEVACGTGRVLLPILKEGFDIDGFDSSPAMISRLHEKARTNGLTVRADVADMREFSMGRRYARLICAFNGFAHCETTEDQIRVLKRSYEHLESGGALIIHMSYPGPDYWSEPDGAPVLEQEVERPGGGKLQLWDNRKKDAVSQRQESEMEIWELSGSDHPKTVHKFTTSQRWVYQFELELLFRAAGFARWEILGGFDGRPLKTADDQMIAWAFKS
jgi:SAM-dependent methyltransferase